MIIAGMGRFGQMVNRLVDRPRAPDRGDRQPPRDGRADAPRSGSAAYYGDVDRPELLEAAGIARGEGGGAGDRRPRADGADGALHPPAATRTCRIIARARDRHHVYRAACRRGARTACARSSTARSRPGDYALAALGHDAAEIEAAAEEFVRQDRRMLEELADALAPGRAGGARTPPISPRRASRRARSRRRCGARGGIRAARRRREPRQRKTRRWQQSAPGLPAVDAPRRSSLRCNIRRTNTLALAIAGRTCARCRPSRRSWSPTAARSPSG